jgi:hypothetical protein
MGKRLNISLTDQSVNEIQELRSLLEKRLIQRLSIAQVIKRMIKIGLEQETNQSEAAE